MRTSFVAFALAVVGCTPPPSHTRSPVDRAPGGGVLVTNQQTCPGDHHCDILEIVDLHTDATSEDKGFDELRTRAAAMGADAVVGAEFEHGEGKEPSHLSGMIVRYGEPVPPHVVLGDVDIPSDPDSLDKGMSAMHQRKLEMGGDRVIDVTFEHGEEGHQGHLRGKVIRYVQ
jgi:uncharacterized protein YbjQ (UPF0145 family)